MDTELSLTIIAISVALLATFLIIVSIFLIKVLIVVKNTTQALDQKVAPLIEGAKKIVDTTGRTTELIKNNVELTTPLFHSIRKITGIVDEFPGRFKNDMHDNSVTLNFEARKGKIGVGDWIEWLGMGIILIQKLRNRSRN